MSGRLTAFTMPFTRVGGGKKLSTEETFSHHVFSTTYMLGYPFQVLARDKSEFMLDIIQEVKSIAIKKMKAFAGCPYKVVNTFFVNSWCRSWTAPFQSTSR